MKQTIEDQALEPIVKQILSKSIELTAAFELKFDKVLERNLVSQKWTNFIIVLFE